MGPPVETCLVRDVLKYHGAVMDKTARCDGPVLRIELSGVRGAGGGSALG